MAKRKARWRLGTMGFGYADWKEVFYPKSLKSGDYLEFYARYFNAVELDTTFHAIPDEERVRKWAEAVPEDFRFSAKAPKDVTHQKDPSEHIPVLNEFVDVMKKGMGEKLGVVLLQFPPMLTFDDLGKLERLLEHLPQRPRFAMEFRHRSWWKPKTAELLKAHDVCWTSIDYPGVPRGVHRTTDFLYVRWIGEHTRFELKDREQVDVRDSLVWWKDEIEAKRKSGDQVWGFFNNDFSGFAVGTCRRLQEMIGERVRELASEKQGELFDG